MGDPFLRKTSDKSKVRVPFSAFHTGSSHLFKIYFFHEKTIPFLREAVDG
jgi:hypothetical protein